MRTRSPNPDGESYPGPGEYQDGKSLIGGPDSIKYTIAERRDGRAGNGFPGPADYNAKDNLTH
jgi:hypothetical protein